MKLYAVQHGEALPEDVDPQRRLTEVGRDEARRLANFLAKAGVRIARIVDSGKTRARQTAEILGARIAPGVAIELEAGLNPNDPVEPVAERIQNWREDTMLVGHLPFLAKLVAVLVGGRGDARVCAFRPGSVVCLERDEAGSWSVSWMLRPELFVGCA